MPVKIRYRCLNCGERFEAEVLTEEEKLEHRRLNRPTGQVQCPKCNRLDIRRGWE